MRLRIFQTFSLELCFLNLHGYGLSGTNRVCALTCSITWIVNNTGLCFTNIRLLFWFRISHRPGVFQLGPLSHVLWWACNTAKIGWNARCRTMLLNCNRAAVLLWRLLRLGCHTLADGCDTWIELSLIESAVHSHQNVCVLVLNSINSK